MFFETSSSQAFEKVSVAGPIQTVMQSFFSVQETYQNNVAFQNATDLTGAVSWTYALSQTNKDTAVCLFLSGYL